MRTLFASIALAAAAFAAFARPAAAQAVGTPPPEFVPVKWYNTPPLTLEELRGKAILVEVFRTW
jgi:hypothetical protein